MDNNNPTPDDRLCQCHWTPLADPDTDLIANCQSCGDFTIALAAWYVLTREASYRRSLVFILTTDLLAKRIVTSPTTALKACRVLEGLGLLTSNTHRLTGTKFKTACERTLHPSVLPWKIAGSTETIDRSIKTVGRCVKKTPPKLARLLQASLEKPSKKGNVIDHAPQPPAQGGAAVRSSVPKKTASAAKVAEPLIQPKAEPPPARKEVMRGATSTGVKFIQFDDGSAEYDWLGKWKD